MGDRQFTRQMATVLSIDAVGYSRLMAEDDETALDAFHERSALITTVCEQHRGRMFGKAGDSLMAEFGNPVDAVRAAVDFQARLEELNAAAPDNRRMAFRVGINTGDVIVDGDLLFGHDVNIAARLQERAPANGVVISQTTFIQVAGKTGFEMASLGSQQLKNIREAVPAFAVARPGEAMAGAAVTSGAREVVRSEGPPAVTVLPFRNQSGDADLDYLGDALAEDLIFGLSNLRWLPVISHASSQQFDADDVSPRDAARSLGARYVVYGKLTRSAENLRLMVLLEDTETQRVLLSRRFDRTAALVRELQDAAGSELVAILSGELDRAEQRRTFQLPWEDMETWQLVARGRFHMARRTSADTKLAHDYFLRAYEHEPASSNVLSELAWWHFWQGFVTMSEEHFRKVIDLCQKALFMDSQDARPHAFLGLTDIMLRRPEQARNHLAAAIRINPSFAFAASGYGSALSLLGNHREGLEWLRKAERLSPFDLYQFHNLGEIAAAHFALGEDRETAEEALRSLSLSPGYWYARMLLVGSLARLGRLDEAREHRAILFDRYPGFTPARIEWIPFADRAVNRAMAEAWELSA
ncbi:adenylate/guanylate cyclase domain-containing protein [Zhengella sp. ZM62]|uniref:adenylate/guanylate cyclase domain-containing protein n=1 Tax=Zhengella sedimenti TaxID=3390035 RepID=UPI003975E254